MAPLYGSMARSVPSASAEIRFFSRLIQPLSNSGFESEMGEVFLLGRLRVRDDQLMRLAPLTGEIQILEATVLGMIDDYQAVIRFPGNDKEFSWPVGDLTRMQPRA